MVPGRASRSITGQASIGRSADPSGVMSRPRGGRSLGSIVDGEVCVLAVITFFSPFTTVDAFFARTWTLVLMSLRTQTMVTRICPTRTNVLNTYGAPPLPDAG